MRFLGSATILLLQPMRWWVGLMLSSDDMPMGPNPCTFRFIRLRTGPSRPCWSLRLS